MPDIQDGESVEMQGSGAKPYVLKNVGGVYSCSCPAWRNQSVGPERRTCKHLRKYRGEAAEEARLGGALPAKPVKAKGDEDGTEEPALLLAETWDNALDPQGWWMSEKLDGVRAFWDGRQFLSRQGNLYHAPDWFVDGLPAVPLDGELWLDRKAFQRTVGIVRRQDKGEPWRTIRYLVFDAPAAGGSFEDRLKFLKDEVGRWQNPFTGVHEHSLCRDVEHLREELRRIESLGGEGIMLREPRSKYVAGRSTSLLKVKTFHDAEATVIRHEPGKGRHQGRLGAVSVRLPNGKEFSVGTGFSDRDREQPPAVGSLITFRYQELSDAGIPRFPSYVGRRRDVPQEQQPAPKTETPPEPPKAAKVSVSAEPPKTSEPALLGSRYFECKEGTSNKYWEVGVVGTKLNTRWGRIGSKGQSKTKTFPSSDAAWAERDSLIEQKLGNSYHEIAARPPGEEEGGEAIRIADADEESGPAGATRPPAPESVSAATVTFSADAAVAKLVSKYAAEYQNTPQGFTYHGDPTVVPTGKIILTQSPAEQIEILKTCYALRKQKVMHGFTIAEIVRSLRECLLKSQLPFTSADVDFLAGHLAVPYGGLDAPLIAVIERWARANPLTETARDNMRKSRDAAEDGRDRRADEKLKVRIDAIVGDQAERNPFNSTEVWAQTAIAEIDGMPARERATWIKLLSHCVAAPSPRPTGEWKRIARQLIDAVSREEFLNVAARWFAVVDKPWPQPRGIGAYQDDPLAIEERNQEILRGLAWCCALEAEPNAARMIGALGASAYRKIRFVGARAVRVGNTCVFCLGAIGDAAAVAELALLKLKVKLSSAQRFIEAECERAATKLGMPRDELEEMSIPAYGLDEVGLRRESLGDFTAELRITAAGDASLQWFKADGSLQKSVPAAVQQDFAEELKELKATAKDIGKMLPAQRERLDGLALARKSWPFAAWCGRYLDHPLVGTLARRLIWRFRWADASCDAAFLEGRLVGHDDREITPAEDAIVELWHPVGTAVEEVIAWRRWLERHEIKQPFKQAHREIYLLTDAEVQTHEYSNRFAGHVIRQSQFRALASTRGWQTKLLGYWDGGDTDRATRWLPAWDLTAEFWTLGLDPADGARYGDSPGMPYIGTDQVRFRRGDAEQPMPLSEVPPLVFSEIMRDVDLFVGVASVGNDPTWVDGGPERRFAEYWRSYAWGELSGTAKTRRDVLERLLPRLKIADRCSLADRYLVVRGDLRTYKIHLGSGNIHMLPNDQYLCIVPKPTAESERVFLPFEGDRLFSIILSKAFLLADDTRIKDPTITRQIRGANGP